MVRRTLLTLTVAAALAVPAQTQAQGLGVDFTSGGVSFNQCCTYTMGYAFTALSSASVSGFALFDYLMDGLNEDHRIGLWKSDGTLLTEATMSAGTGALMGTWRTLTLGSAVALATGTQYVVAATNYRIQQGGDYYTGLVSGFTVDSRISYDGDRWDATNGFDVSLLNTSGNTAGNGGGWFGANVILSAPEPGSMLLLVTSLFGLGVAARRRREDVTD